MVKRLQIWWMDCNDIWVFQEISGSESEAEQLGMEAKDLQWH